MAENLPQISRICCPTQDGRFRIVCEHADGRISVAVITDEQQKALDAGTDHGKITAEITYTMEYLAKIAAGIMSGDKNAITQPAAARVLASAVLVLAKTYAETDGGDAE